MDMTQTVVAGIMAVLAGAGGTKIISHFLDRRGGLRSEVDQMARERDEEARKRRMYAEALSATRRIVIEAPCLSADDLPAWPE